MHKPILRKLRDRGGKTARAALSDPGDPIRPVTAAAPPPPVHCRGASKGRGLPRGRHSTSVRPADAQQYRRPQHRGDSHYGRAGAQQPQA